MKRNLYFFIGTEAELMKMFKVISEARKRGFNCKIISNGQNLIDKSPFLELAGGRIDIDLTQYADKSKTSLGYLKWFFKTKKLGIKLMKAEMLREKGNQNLMVVHGDTLTTLMGSKIAMQCKLKYVHVESGARSYNWFSPFPEEIDRYFSSLHSIANFCPKKEFADYAAKAFKGKSVNTMYNTGIETLFYALEENKRKHLPRPMKEKYFVLAIHRQENLLNKAYMTNIIDAAVLGAKKLRCLFIYHEQTKAALERFGLWKRIIHDKNFEIVGRQGYCEFINTIVCSEFIMADGCGNQQEMYYLGQPYLIMRTKVEKDSEGLGWNAKWFENNFKTVNLFFEEYKNYKKDIIVPHKLPSLIIADVLEELFDNGEV